MPEKGNLPGDIPATPRNTYKDKGWMGMNDWLTGTIVHSRRIFRPFEEARFYARGLGLKNRDGWIAFCQGEMPENGTLPEDIPAKPDKTYKNMGWQGMGDWLGTGNIANYLKIYRPFEEARSFARSLNLKTQSEWRKFCKGEMLDKGTLPEDIPSRSDKKYKNKGWVSWSDWLVAAGDIK